MKVKPELNIVSSIQPAEPTAASQMQTGLQPALEQIGIVPCPICKREVAIHLTKTNRPFMNCGFCSARIFYNGREAIRRLLEHMRPVSNETSL